VCMIHILKYLHSYTYIYICSHDPFRGHTWKYRENILVGAVFEKERYERAVEVSCLGPDLEALPAGDRCVSLCQGGRERERESESDEI